MKKGKKIKEKNRTKKEVARDQYTVVLERVEDKVDFLAEGQSGLRQELHEFKNEMYDFRDEVCGFRDEMCGFRDDVKSSFKSVMEHLYRIENEIKDLKG